MRNAIKKALVGSSEDDVIENIELLIDAKVDEARANWIRVIIVVTLVVAIVFILASIRH